ncbi:MAG: diguanylate cyclase [Anaerolineae bacterium]
MAGERVLIVDDEESIQSLLVQVCEGAGYLCSSVGTVTGACEILAETYYNVCIVDLRLPDGNGMDVLRTAKQVHPDSEVVVLTGHADVYTAIESLRLGAYDYLQKPVFDLQVIVTTIAHALERQQMAKRNAQLLSDLQVANSELDRRRRQQLHYISHIGHALAGALRSREVVQVLIRAMLNSIDCEGVGVLLLHRNGGDSPWAMVGGPTRMGPDLRRGLLEAMLGHLSEEYRPHPDAVVLEELPGQDAAELDEVPWGRMEFSLLAVRDDMEGVVVMAGHRNEPFGEEALGFFGILAAQGSAALANAHLFALAREQATRDSLTGLFNRRHFFELLEIETIRAERYNQELAVLMLDMDRAHGLKVINDSFGHAAGDEVLRTIARCLEAGVRRHDAVARYGGDEFIILAPQTGHQEALMLATRLCERIEGLPLKVADRETYLTVSIGAAVFEPGRDESASSVVDRADRASYIAKERGGNQAYLLEQ